MGGGSNDHFLSLIDYGDFVLGIAPDFAGESRGWLDFWVDTGLDDPAIRGGINVS